MSHLSKLVKHKEGVLGTSALQPVDQEHRLQPGPSGKWHLKWEQSCRTELLNCGIRCCLWIDSAGSELNCRTPSRCRRIRCGKHTHTHTHTHWDWNQNCYHLCFLPEESRHVTLAIYQYVHPSESPTELQCPQISLGFHQVGNIIDHVTELNFSPPPPPWW